VIAEAVRPVHGELADYLGMLRKRIREMMPSIAVRNEFWQALFTTDPVEVIRTGGWDRFRAEAEELVRKYSGKAQSCE